MSMGEKILQLRKSSGLSQEQFASMLGVSRQAISKWETDQSIPDIDKVVSISKVFSITVDELLGNEANSYEAEKFKLQEIVQRNASKRQFTLGWITVVSGLILLVVELLSLRVIQYNAMKLDLEYAAGTGFYSDPMAYAYIEPMPIIFKVTVAIILLGIVLIVYSLIRSSRAQRPVGKVTRQQ